MSLWMETARLKEPLLQTALGWVYTGANGFASLCYHGPPIQSL